MAVAARGRSRKGLMLKVLPLLAIGLILSALVLGILLFVVGIPLPWRQAPGKEEPPTLSYTWIAPSDLPANHVIVNASDLKDYPDVLNGIQYREDGTITMDQVRYDALDRDLNIRCQKATGGPCIAVLSLQGEYYILLLI